MFERSELRGFPKGIGKRERRSDPTLVTWGKVLSPRKRIYVKETTSPPVNYGNVGDRGVYVV